MVKRIVKKSQRKRELMFAKGGCARNAAGSRSGPHGPEEANSGLAICTVASFYINPTMSNSETPQKAFAFNGEHILIE